MTVRPIYVIDEGRKSLSTEMKAMKDIREMLKLHPETIFNFLPTLVIAEKDISANTQITASYEYLHEKYLLGSQYDFLARLANYLNEDLEIGVTFDPRGKVARTIYGEGAITKEIPENKHVLSYLDIDFTNASENLMNIFIHLKMPISLFHITKPTEYQRMCNMGLKEVADRTWFCHNPIMGLTCGWCNPCKDALHEGMAWRVSKWGRILGFFRAAYVKFNKTIFP